MTYTQLHPISLEGDVQISDVEINNASRAAPMVWSAVLKGYSTIDPEEKHPVVDRDAFQEVKRLSKDPDIPKAVRAVILSTFERMIVRSEELPEFIGYMEEFVETLGHHMPGHSLGEQLELLRGYAEQREGLHGVCWDQTSVGTDWESITVVKLPDGTVIDEREIEDQDMDYDAEDFDWRSFNINRDVRPSAKIHYLFDHLNQANM